MAFAPDTYDKHAQKGPHGADAARGERPPERLMLKFLGAIGAPRDPDIVPQAG